MKKEKLYDMYKGKEFIATGTLTELAKLTGYKRDSLRHFVNADIRIGGRAKYLILPIEGSELPIYALYQGDKLLATGNKYELAEFLDVTPKTIVRYNTKYYKKQIDMSKHRYTVRIE